MASQAELKRFSSNLADELDSAALYDTLAQAEKQEDKRLVYAELAEAERRHADIWAAKLRANGVSVGAHRIGAKTRIMRMLARAFGPDFVLRSVAANEMADRDKYAGQPDAAQMSAEERHHADIVQEVANRNKGLDKGNAIAAAESWHRGVASGNDLRAAVLGANDGLVSNFCLIMGVAGAGSDSRTVLLTAFAGLIAGAASMALGEWLSVTNARELARTQIAKEKDELDHMPDAERHELALIYQAKGIDPAEARRVAAEIMRDKDKALDTLTREELGLDPRELGGNPWTAALASFTLFAIGAICPAVAFLWSSGAEGIVQCIALSGLGLAAIGVFTSLFNGRGALFSAVRQVLIGMIAAGCTFGLGKLLGVSLS
ncbi:VIT1/CCC1 transporter family protein [Caballeronia ptereochthonis]|uniref:VIT family protein n=1 Tax=Caballeronia ptereochthonis TaxID=1777144 RepID=A0A158D0K8_9BURK|nr:VIT1/CCC1 transporter family protein [Caballeronia ptereochthonis]SAK88011.1 VIT family protein [Caballeronia ptereochthonis]